MGPNLIHQPVILKKLVQIINLLVNKIAKENNINHVLVNFHHNINSNNNNNYSNNYNRMFFNLMIYFHSQCNQNNN